MHENGENLSFTVHARKIKKKSFIVRFRPGTINAETDPHKSGHSDSKYIFEIFKSKK